MPDIEKTIVDQKITATNGSYIENVKQEIHIHSSDSLYRKPIQAPPLIEEFVEIPKKEEIKTLLFNNNSRKILAITAIQGLGGIGKTTLAIVLAHDEEVQKHFSDGTLWATLGQEPDKLSLLNSWIQELGDYHTNYSTIETASIHLSSLLYGKHILLVVDDVWESKDVEPFLVGGLYSQTIITTRKTYIAEELDAKSCSLEVMTKEQSLELFKNVLKDCWDEYEKENALKVAKDVGYLPLALNLAAKRRKRGYSWIELHKALEKEIACLNVLESPRKLRKGEEGLEASLNLSLKALRFYDKKAYEDFVWLGVIPEDVKINERMVSTIWSNDNEEAREVLEVLWEEGLLTYDSIIELKNENLKTYRMHDLFHDIARHYLTLSPVAEKATDIPGLGLKLSEAHTSLLSRYQLQTQKKGVWHTLVDDAYIHSHLTWHMEKAGQIENIHKLLIEETENGKNGWYETLESLGKSAVFIEDVMKAWNLSEKDPEHQIEQGNKASSIGLQIRYALINSSINSLSANMPVELLSTLFETKRWTVAKVLIYALREPDPHIRVDKLISIYQKTKDESIKKEELMENALDAASKIRDDKLRAEALLKIVPHLDGQRKEELMEKAFDIAFYIQDFLESRERVLSVIVPNLDRQRKEELMERFLDAVSEIEDDYTKVWVLSAIVPYFDGERKEELMEEALNVVSKIRDDYSRAYALSHIILNLDGQRKEEVLEKALDAASKIGDDYERAKFDYIRSKVLSAIIPHIGGQRKEELIEKALDIAYKIEKSYARVRIFSAIIPKLDGQRKEELTEKALDLAFDSVKNLDVSTFELDFTGKLALSYIVPNLDGQRKEKVLEKALDLASKIRDDELRAEALLDIIPHLDEQRKEELMEKALSVASKIEDDKNRARVLSVIVPNLDGQRKEELIEKALDAASTIQTGYTKVWILSVVAPNLNGQRKEELIEKELDITYKIEDSYARVWAFSAIIPKLDGQRKEEVLEKALDLASSSTLGYGRTYALSRIMLSLDGQRKEEVLEKALDEASKIGDDYERAQAFSAIIPKLDGQRKEELTEKALDLAFGFVGKNAIELLSYIVPNLDGQRKENVLEKALAVASKIQYDEDRARALSYIVPNLDGQRKEELMEKAVNIAYKIEDSYARVWAFSAIIPKLDGQRKEEVLEKALDLAFDFVKVPDTSFWTRNVYAREEFLAIIPHLDGKTKEKVLEKALDQVSKIENDYEKGDVLFDLVPHLEGKRKKELVEKALDIAYKIKYGYPKALALSAILSKLDGQRNENAISQIRCKFEASFLRILERTDLPICNFPFGNLLGFVIQKNRLTVKEEILEKALDAASKIRDDEHRAKALSAIIPHLDGQRKEEGTDEALDAASSIVLDYSRLEALSHIVPSLNGQREELFEKVFDIASTFQNDEDRAKVLLSTVPYLDEKRKEELIEKIFDIASKIEYDGERAHALRIMFSYLRSLPRDDLYFWWKRVIRNLKELTRTSLLLDIITLIPVISDLDEGGTFSEISQAITDVTRWWP